MTIPLKEIGSCKWEIPQDREKGMRVPGIVYSNKELIEGIASDESLNQVRNVSNLPGIVRASMAMPDIHLGYGFPIGGVAAFDMDEGVVSPGGVGYDINCLRGDSHVMGAFGTWERISDVTRNTVVCYDSEIRKQKGASLLLSMTSKRHKKILLIRTECGKELFATHDHPVLSESGMKEASLLRVGDRIVVKGFEGLEYSKPTSDYVLNEEILTAKMEELGISNSGNSKAQLLAHIAKLGLMNLKLDDPKLSYLLKIMGLVFGDGILPRSTLITTIYGTLEDLQDVKKDLALLGVPSGIYSRNRKHDNKTHYGSYKFESTEYSLKISSRAFGLVLGALGVPVGNKSLQPYFVPHWIMSSERWQKRLFIASYFGAELSAPRSNGGVNFHSPALSLNKLESLSSNSIVFLSQIRDILSQLEIGCTKITKVDGYTHFGKRGKTVGYRLQISPNSENLIKFFSTVSYEYNRRKADLSGIASLFLGKSHNLRKRRDSLRATAIEMNGYGKNAEEMLGELAVDESDTSFVEYSVNGRTGKSGVWNQERFSEFLENSVISEDFVYDRIEEIRELPYDAEVYDLMVDDPNHNFIANGIVVSNCGVRLVRTDLTEKEVKPTIKSLVDSIFENVPSGVGREGRLSLGSDKMEDFLTDGVRHVVSEGYGWSRDIERIEEGGSVPFADRTKVSERAKKRGFPQLGSLGAGNHFLEIQVVDKIYDPEIARKFGLLSEGQITIMVHTGSRGFGHQVATDYLEVVESAMKKYNLTVPDRQLASVPYQSKEAHAYLGAMGAAANFGFSNRQIITHWIRESFRSVFKRDPEEMGMDIVYDVCHNIAKVEEHSVDGKNRDLIVHRKGATRAFPAGRKELPPLYRETGHPVIIPGTMGTFSYVLVGTQRALDETFGSTCHGSGRVMSRSRAVKQYTSQAVASSLEQRGTYVRAATKYVLQEEAPLAYKDVEKVVGSVECAGISKIVARLRPIGVMKG